ncbi:unnamed protein product [Acanthoscelides obtectus]|uniref:Receptor-binding cancer antigen expressed on SiSo cells n=1 Tax=Acanthoscelides obtectus TaxID=200917 RepID=A0A9P0KD74_ACAOB|nr:unnamed protein product [Acanthoscelides obtectus]CAK1662374.1 hypothetical protein AOBTE_LOCUS23110 [Acanthoscelides obtectus]
MIFSVVITKLKSLVLLLVNLFGRALCCFKRRRRDSNSECVPLTHVVSGRGEESFQNWEWEDNLAQKEPKTVQDHIELYRKQKTQAVLLKESNEAEEQLNFFEDMTPKITKQTKILLNTGQQEANKTSGNRLSLDESSVDSIITDELREWDESSGWESDLLDQDAQKALREKKRQERERKAWEQQQKRQEKMLKPLGKLHCLFLLDSTNANLYFMAQRSSYI